MNETDRARTSEKIAAIRDSNSTYFHQFTPDRFRPLRPLGCLWLPGWPWGFIFICIPVHRNLGDVVC